MKLAPNAEIIGGEDYSMLCSSAAPQFIVILVDASVSMKRVIEGITCAQRACEFANHIMDVLIKVNFNKDCPKNRLFICVASYDIEVKPIICGYLSSVYDCPLRVDEKKRGIIGSDGKHVEFMYPQPIWVDLTATDYIANLKAGIDYARERISHWSEDNYETPAPIVVNITCDNYAIDEPLSDSIKELKKMRTSDGETLFLNLVVAAEENIVFPIINEREGKDNNLILASSIIPINYQIRIWDEIDFAVKPFRVAYTSNIDSMINLLKASGRYPIRTK